MMTDTNSQTCAMYSQRLGDDVSWANGVTTRRSSRSRPPFQQHQSIPQSVSTWCLLHSTFDWHNLQTSLSAFQCDLLRIYLLEQPSCSHCQNNYVCPLQRLTTIINCCIYCKHCLTGSDRWLCFRWVDMLAQSETGRWRGWTNGVTGQLNESRCVCRSVQSETETKSADFFYKSARIRTLTRFWYP